MRISNAQPLLGQQTSLVAICLRYGLRQAVTPSPSCPGDWARPARFVPHKRKWRLVDCLRTQVRAIVELSAHWKRIPSSPADYAISPARSYASSTAASSLRPPAPGPSETESFHDDKAQMLCNVTECGVFFCMTAGCIADDIPINAGLYTLQDVYRFRERIGCDLLRWGFTCPLLII
jgi:hypothetical protein